MVKTLGLMTGGGLCAVGLYFLWPALFQHDGMLLAGLAAVLLGLVLMRTRREARR